MSQKLQVDLTLLKTLSVLYVEDNEDIREQLAQFLRRRVGTLHVAANGQEGLDVFRREQPDIVITDILMPVMDGLKMSEIIKNEEPATPIIVTTAFNEQDYFIKAIDIGIDKYVIKPINTESLLEAVYKSALILLQRREIDAHNRFIQYMLDMNPNFVVVSDLSQVEFINKTFLAYLGYNSLEDFRREHRCIDAFFVKVDGIPYTGENTQKWAETLIASPVVTNHIVYLRTQPNAEPKAFIVTFTQIPDTRKYIFSFTDITQLEQEKLNFAEQAIRDPLTGIFNREKFDTALMQEIERASRYHAPFSLVMFDIDRFKSINDNYGHHAGDNVLRGITALVTENIREIDIFARWGGEEFIILVNGTPLNQSRQLAEKLREIIETFSFSEIGHITCSFGVAEFADDDNEEKLLERVDKALYRAKDEGRNRVAIATP
ncbi:MAG: diguanylate cyclase [Sulfuricellaceae bacterium]|nr:diguanylate cyclase [Sulfuricellaceae bacterium]